MGEEWVDKRLRDMGGKHGISLAIQGRTLILGALGMKVGKGLGCQGTIQTNR